MCEYNIDKDIPESQIKIELPDGVLIFEKIRSVWIDVCIAHVISFLWDNRIETVGSCCGHYGRFGNPNITIPRVCYGYDMDMVHKILELIKTVDDRTWDIFQFQLAKVN